MDRRTSYGSAEARAPSATIKSTWKSAFVRTRAGRSQLISFFNWAPLPAFSVPTAAKGTLGNTQAVGKSLKGSRRFRKHLARREDFLVPLWQPLGGHESDFPNVEATAEETDG